MKVGLLTAIWGRHDITQLVLDYYAGLPLDRRLCVASPDDEGECMLNYRGWDVVYHPNQPLSEKWNHGMSRMKDCDAVIIVGSDDLVTPKYIDACRYLLDGGAEYIMLEGAFFLDAPTRRMCYAKTRRLGLGRCLSRSLLERVDWQPWPGGLQFGLDSGMERVLFDHAPGEVRIADPVKHGLVGLDIKTGENIWGYDHVRDNLVVQDVDPEAILNEHFPNVAPKLLEWNERETNRTGAIR